MTVLAIIPARGGSKGIPDKNLTMCGGKPLIQWTTDAVREADLVDIAILSTDSEAICDAADMWYRLCDPISDEAQIEDRLDAVIDNAPLQADIIVLLQPTSPVRRGNQIDEAIAQLVLEELDSLVSVVPSHAFLWVDDWATYDWSMRPRRQETKQQYEENGSIYVFTRQHWERTHNRLGGKIGTYVMPEECRMQIDTPFDLWMVEQILERQKAPAI